MIRSAILFAAGLAVAACHASAPVEAPPTEMEEPDASDDCGARSPWHTNVCFHTTQGVICDDGRL